MRLSPFISGLLLLALVHGPLHAQTALTALYQARVKANETLVRSGPSLDPKIYPTNKLNQGDYVKVVKEREDGWLEIVPPPGSFSWVNQLFVEGGSKDNPNTWIVSKEDSRTYYGSKVWSGQPNIISAKLDQGVQLISVGQKFTRPNTAGVWLPIQPPPSEVRYIQAKDVDKDDGKTPAAAVVKATSNARDQNGELPDPDLPPPGKEIAEPQPRKSPVGSAAQARPDTRIAEAQHAERLGDRQRAISLWIEVGRQYEKNGQVDLSNQCYKRADWLKSQTRVASPQNNCCVPCSPVQQRCWPNTMDGRLSAVPASRLQPVAMQPVANTYASSRPVDTVSWNSAQPPAPAEPPRASAAPASGVLQGHLTVAKSMVDGKRAYLLTSSKGELISFAIGESDLDLERYVGTNVELHGVVTYRTDPRGLLIRAVSVQPLQ